VPAAVALRRVHRDDGLDLVARAQPPLVHDLVADERLGTASDRGRIDDFVLGERLLGEEGPRQVQVAGGPGAIGAETPEVRHGRVDVGVAERVAERRHVPRQAAHRPAFVHDAEPVDVGFRRGERAVGEIGERCREADDGPRRSPAVGAVAGQTGGPVDGLAARRWRLRRHARQSRQPAGQSRDRARRALTSPHGPPRCERTTSGPMLVDEDEPQMTAAPVRASATMAPCACCSSRTNR
jgi:hypothetical protein